MMSVERGRGSRVRPPFPKVHRLDEDCRGGAPKRQPEASRRAETDPSRSGRVARPPARQAESPAFLVEPPSRLSGRIPLAGPASALSSQPRLGVAPRVGRGCEPGRRRVPCSNEMSPRSTQRDR